VIIEGEEEDETTHSKDIPATEDQRNGLCLDRSGKPDEKRRRQIIIMCCKLLSIAWNGCAECAECAECVLLEQMQLIFIQPLHLLYCSNQIRHHTKLFECTHVFLEQIYARFYRPKYSITENKCMNIIFFLKIHKYKSFLFRAISRLFPSAWIYSLNQIAKSHLNSNFLLFFPIILISLY
jgi:hypothetical protein